MLNSMGLMTRTRFFSLASRRQLGVSAGLLRTNTHNPRSGPNSHRNMSTSVSTRRGDLPEKGFKDTKSESSVKSGKDYGQEKYLLTSEVTKLASEIADPIQKAKEQANILPDDANIEAAADDFLTTIFENMEPYMDTYEVYKQLVRAGFTPSQSDEIINMIIVQLNSKLSKLSTKYSQAYELENEQYLFESAQQELRVDITRNRENHINESINQINALERDYAIISDQLNNNFIQMKNDIQVAINDQKSENTLMSKKIMLRIQETNHKITTELNMAMRSEIESLRWHLSRWGLIAILISVFLSCAAFYVYKIQNQTKSKKNEFVPLVIYEPSEFDEDDYHADLDPNVL